MFSFLLSCEHRNENIVVVDQKERKNIVGMELYSIEDSLPAMHSLSSPLAILGDTLIMIDFQSTDLIFTAYDVRSGQTIGRFGRFGNGPGEISNFGSETLDPIKKILYVQNTSQWNFVGFELDKAISDSNYRAFLKFRYPTDESKLLSSPGNYLSDSVVIVVAHIPNKDWTDFRYQLGQLDITTGKTTLYETYQWENEGTYYITVSEKNDMIVLTGNESDIIEFHDLKGNLKKKIYGPRYKPTYKKNARVMRRPILTEDRLYVIYREKGNRERYGEDILEFDLEGNYLRTLRTGIPLLRIQYHKGTNRLYFSSTAEPQFGYIQL